MKKLLLSLIASSRFLDFSVLNARRLICRNLSFAFERSKRKSLEIMKQHAQTSLAAIIEFSQEEFSQKKIEKRREGSFTWVDDKNSGERIYNEQAKFHEQEFKFRIAGASRLSRICSLKSSRIAMSYEWKVVMQSAIIRSRQIVCTVELCCSLASLRSRCRSSSSSSSTPSRNHHLLLRQYANIVAVQYLILWLSNALRCTSFSCANRDYLYGRLI